MHVLVLGQTLSGKSLLSKRLANGFMRQGIGVLVYDPIGDAEWDCSFKTDNFLEFLEVYWTSERCMAFIDEAGDVCGRFDGEAVKTATKGRHKGHINYYISQRATLLSPTIRDQCSQLFLFNSGLKDCQTHAQEWNTPELLNGTSLKKGEIYHCQRMGDTTKQRLF